MTKEDGKVLVHAWQKRTGKLHEFRLKPGDHLPDGFVDSPDKVDKPSPGRHKLDEHGNIIGFEPDTVEQPKPQEEGAADAPSTAIGDALNKAQGHGRGQEQKAAHANPNAKKGAA